MSLVVVPPLTDPTVQVQVRRGERLVDLNERFAARVEQWLRAPGPEDAAGAEDQDDWTLLAGAAADVFAGPAGPADPHTRLRALGAGIRVLSAADAGLTATLDDIELRTGDTECVADVRRAASACTLFDPDIFVLELGREPVELVVDSDQQLPAVLRLLGGRPPNRRTPRSPADVTLSGAFVAAHRAALERLPELAGVRLRPETRRRVVRAQWWNDSSAPPRWVHGEAAVPMAEPWAGWLTGRRLLQLSPRQLDCCQGLVVTVAEPTAQALLHGEFTGRGLAGRLVALAARFPLAIEILIGGPSPGPGAEDLANWPAHGAAVRLAGFRPYRPAWQRATSRPAGRELARWSRPAEEGTLARVRRLLSATAGRVPLYPGRVAAALFPADTGPGPVEGYRWDPAARLVRERYLVNLRTGGVTRVPPPMARLLASLRRGGVAAQRIITELPAARRERLLIELNRVGAVHERAVQV